MEQVSTPSHSRRLPCAVRQQLELGNDESIVYCHDDTGHPITIRFQFEEDETNQVQQGHTPAFPQKGSPSYYSNPESSDMPDWTDNSQGTSENTHFAPSKSESC